MSNTKTPVSILQELLMKRSAPLPHYHFTQISTLQPEFECTVTVNNITAIGRAFSKHEAKYKSAEMLLKKLRHDSTHSTSTNPITQYGNFVGRLNEFASQNRLPYPTYTECRSNSTYLLQFAFKCEFGTLQATGAASNKKDAKQKAAFEMLEKLQGHDLSEIFPNCNNNINSSSDVSISTAVVDELAAHLYQKLSFNLSERQKVQEDIPKVATTTIFETLDTVEKLRDVLIESGVIYTVTTFQTKPLILMLQIKNSNQTIMETGAVYDEVLYNLLKKALLFYNSKVLSELAGRCKNCCPK